jgi:hypothetical protein
MCRCLQEAGHGIIEVEVKKRGGEWSKRIGGMEGEK